MVPRAAYGVLACTLLAGCDVIFRIDEVPDPDPAMVGEWRRVAAGDGTTCGITSADRLYCWGRNEDGQLGIGEDGGERIAPAPIAGTTWTDVTLGRTHGCGIQTDGSLWCWGDGNSDQLGHGASTDSSMPVRVGTDSWAAVVASGTVTCAIREPDRALYCWGDNKDYELGDGTTIDSNVPKAVVPGMSWASVSVGQYHVCAIDDAAALWCWGRNYYGGLGDGTSTEATTPNAVPGGQRWAQVSAAEGYTCGVLDDGRALCWGRNVAGSLGDGTSAIDQRMPRPLATTHEDWVEVQTAPTYACGRREDGSLWCWGDGASTSVGAPSNVPVEVAGEGGVVAIALGRTHTCRIAPAGGLACTGDGSAGQRGDGASGAITAPERVSHPQDAAWIDVDAGDDFTCALDAMGTAYCWGVASDFELGDGLQVRQLVPMRLAFENVTSLSAGTLHACAITTAGSLDQTWCWGTNHGGSLGNGSSSSVAMLPVAVAGTFMAVAAGDHTCALESDGTAWCWGSNLSGQLGVAGQQRRTQPTQVVATEFAAIATSYNHTCALEPSGTLWCWGSNSAGQVGRGSTAPHFDLPELTFLDTSYQSVFATHQRTCAISRADASPGNTTYCWGANAYGSLGMDATNVPTQISDATAWTQLALGQFHTCGLRDTGAVHCWGRNDRGQLGDGTLDDRELHAPAGATTTWRHITAGARHTCGLQESGELWCWGSNRDGQLGTGTGWTSTWNTVEAP